jgi:hypothetical protein
LINIFHRKKKDSSNAESYRFIKTTIDGYAKKIDAPESLLPTYGYSESYLRPYIEIDNRKTIHLKIKKRFWTIKKVSAIDLKHIIYSVFENVTETMAKDYEIKNRINKHDPRRLEFNKQEELLGLINPDYKKWIKNKHEKILMKKPFVDSGN